ncbi:MAG: endonuclease/exonuclease/phosphatase family protein [Coleofasciculus sp. S288]|nr:endonuclease/exonuclease/phosphatase family protein [Coleofasciculus sp. S288]
MRLTNKNNLLKSRNNLIAYCLLLGIVVTTLLSLSSYVGWIRLLEMLSHFRVQYLAISLLLFGLLLLTRKKHFIIASLFCVSLLLVEIIPWYIPQAWAVSEPSGKIRVFLSNVNDRNESYSKVISLVREENPDVAVFDEVNDAWRKQLNSLKEILPYSTEWLNPSRPKIGVTVYSKFPLRNVAIDYFGTTTKPGILANLNLNGQVISLIAAHPLPPFKPNYFQSRNKQLEEIGEYVSQLKTPVLVVGDLNITMWSPYYKKFVSDTGLSNARQGFGILPSWPAKSSVSRVPNIIAPLMLIPIDQVLISPEIKVSKIKIGRNVGSDHLPVIADLVMSNG